jgi:hypothetical protein
MIALAFTGHEFGESGEIILQQWSRHRAHASFFLTGDFLRNPDFTNLVRKIAHRKNKRQLKGNVQCQRVLENRTPMNPGPHRSGALLNHTDSVDQNRGVAIRMRRFAPESRKLRLRKIRSFKGVSVVIQPLASPRNAARLQIEVDIEVQRVPEAPHWACRWEAGMPARRQIEAKTPRTQNSKFKAFLDSRRCASLNWGQSSRRQAE